MGVAGALAAHGEDLAGEPGAEVLAALFESVVEVDVGVFVHFQEVGDARRVAQDIGQGLRALGLVDLLRNHADGLRVVEQRRGLLG